MRKYFTVAAFLSLMCKVSFLLAQSVDGDRFIETALKVQRLDPWQTQIALKESKDVSDYFLLLPKQLFEGEVGVGDDTEEFRLSLVNEGKGRINVAAGYVEVASGFKLVMALFRNRVDKVDVIAVAIGCGVPPVQFCDYGFIEFDPQSKKWTFSDVFPWTDFNRKCEAIKANRSKLNGSIEPFIPNIVLPDLGTTINVVDAWDTKKEPVFKVVWNGARFEVQ
ncbi:hypothetical protein RT717_10330 [Imperialibacter roseus]|uniref:Uncharacterized protein n=1 Tax=Imperialibacter roseus TaxID=1324217 RepID=A0ABZ0IW60_9BACT|nr:hypothetical protein [Imperialibacter roseus]WOK09031.1 hypothetical protein RT717_10330 [Imperialibacter roseus]